MKPKTADQLEPGTYFTGTIEGQEGETLELVKGCEGVVLFADIFITSGTRASEWVVIKEHGTFKVVDDA